jgi:hypothetical protein
VEEKLSHGSPSFFVRGKMFASFADDHHGDERLAAWCKATPERQRELVADNPARYFVPPYVGVKGWVGVHIDPAAVDWEELALILEEGWTAVAPKSARSAPVLPPPAAKPLARTDPEVSARAFARIEALVATLEGAECERSGHHATWRVKKKPFAYFLDNHHGDGVIAVSVRAPDGENDALVARSPAVYFIPPYIGVRGWVGIRLNRPNSGPKVDWGDVETRLHASHARVAPKPRPASRKKTR